MDRQKEQILQGTKKDDKEEREEREGYEKEEGGGKGTERKDREGMLERVKYRVR